MIKNKTKYSIILIVIAIFLGLNFSSIHAYLSEVQNKSYYQSALHLNINSAMGENIYSINSQYELDIYNSYYQEEVSNKIDGLMKKNEIEKTPVIIYNPYGTNTSSFYFSYFADKDCTLEYTVHVNDEDISDYKQNATTSKVQEGIYASQLIGFIPNMENTVTIQIKDGDTVVQSYTYTMNVPKSESNVQTKLEVSELAEGQELSDGLYAMFGLDKSFDSNIYLFDNEGILRSELPLKNYRSDRIIFTDETMIYSYRKSGLIEVDKLGKIVEFYDFDGYKQHHDFIYDEENNKFLILVNKDGESTIEDFVIAVDADTKEVSEVANMKELLPSLYEQALSPEEGNTYGGDELDWIHLNSLTLDGDDLIVSSRELSSIIKISDIYGKSKVDYIIADENIYSDSEYADTLLSKASDFISQTGQHAITYEEDDSLEEGQYYLYMFNNNFTSSRTRQDIDWSFIEGAGTYTKGDNSYYYKYLVDEKEGTYDLVDKIAIPYSSIVSSVQEYENNIVSSSGMSTCFNEYDSDGNLIRQFNYDAEKYAYRVFKYSFIGFYFK